MTTLDPPRRPATPWKLLLAIAAALGVLTAVFGARTLRSRAAFSTYRAETLEHPAEPLPWTERELELLDCVRWSVAWGMACPSIESWCFGEAPRITRTCLESRPRAEVCEGLEDRAASTRFGFSECEALRSEVEGTYARRSHKKLCAASFRAVAAYCRASP